MPYLHRLMAQRLLERLGQRGVGLPLAASTTNTWPRPSQSAAALRLRSEVAAASTLAGVQIAGSSAAWVAAPMAAPAEESAADELSLEQLITQARKPAVSASPSAFSAACLAEYDCHGDGRRRRRPNPSLPPPTRRVRVRYNHYKSDFAVVAGASTFGWWTRSMRSRSRSRACGPANCATKVRRSLPVASWARIWMATLRPLAPFSWKKRRWRRRRRRWMKEYVLVVEEDLELANAPRRVYDASGTTSRGGCQASGHRAAARR